MNLRSAVRISLVFVVFAALLCWSSDGKPATVKGYVLDGMCVYQRSEEANQPRLRQGLCQGGISVGNSV